jgi:hypothetical protein
MNDSDLDSIDHICNDLFQKIRSLEKMNAYYSVHTLVDSFLGITDLFSINPSEYEYYRDKYHDNHESEQDMPRKEIIQYLSTIIKRLELITDKSFNPESEPNLDAESDSEKNQDLLTEDAIIHEEYVLHEQLAEEIALQEQLKDYPELQEIFEDTMNNENRGKQISLRKQVFSLKYFQGNVHEMDYLKKQKEKLE